MSSPDTGGEEADHDPRRCAVACYECLWSYTNQQEHRYLDRRLVKDFLVAVASGSTTVGTDSETREEQYERLRSAVDPASPLEGRFLQFLYEGDYRLPDRAQSHPAPDIASQPDFYYRREGRDGCVFVDGAVHDEPIRAARDESARAALEERGFRVIAIRFDGALAEQVAQYSDVFGSGS